MSTPTKDSHAIFHKRSADVNSYHHEPSKGSDDSECECGFEHFDYSKKANDKTKFTYGDYCQMSASDADDYEESMESVRKREALQKSSAANELKMHKLLGEKRKYQESDKSKKIQKKDATTSKKHQKKTEEQTPQKKKRQAVDESNKTPISSVTTTVETPADAATSSTAAEPKRSLAAFSLLHERLWDYIFSSVENKDVRMSISDDVANIFTEELKLAKERIIKQILETTRAPFHGFGIVCEESENVQKDCEELCAVYPAVTSRVFTLLRTNISPERFHNLLLDKVSPDMEVFWRQITQDIMEALRAQADSDTPEIGYRSTN